MTSHDLSASRRDYSGEHIDQAALPDDPMELFGTWFDQATAATDPKSSREPNAMTVATVREELDGTWRPRARVVLMKGFDERGLTFFTNYESDKGRELAHDPWASASFWWPEEARQVRFEGQVAKVTPEESAAYFAQRPRGSQIGAAASDQSRPVESPEELAQKVDAASQQYEGRDVPCPEFWGGYRLTPTRVEFWQGQPSRLHDRIRYVRDAPAEGETGDGVESTTSAWRTQRLQP